MDRINEMLGQLQELNDEQVAELESSILSEFDNVEGQDLTAENVDNLESLASAVEAVRNEQSRRSAERESLTTKAAEAATRVRGDQSTEAQDPEAPVDGAPEGEGEASTSSKYDPNAPAIGDAETPVDEADPADELDSTLPGDMPADIPDPADEARKRRAGGVPPPSPAMPARATATADTPAEAELTTIKEAVEAKEKGEKVEGDTETKSEPEPAQAEASNAEEPAPAETEASTTEEPAPAQAEASVAEEPAPAETEASTAEEPTPAQTEAAASEATTTEESPKGAEAAGESEGTTAEAPAEAENSNQDPEEDVTTPVAASGQDASLEIEAPADRRPIPVPTATVSITAGADIPGVTAGTKFEDMDKVAEAFVSRLHTLRHVHGGDGEQHIVASMQYDFPENRVLQPNDPANNTDLIQKVTAPEALTAAAGICLPLETRYDMQCDIGVLDRPIRDSLARFGADRGGIRFFNAPVLADMAGATGFWRGDTDGQNWHTYGPDGTTATSPANLKPCLEVQCTSEVTAYIEAVTLCLTFNNLTTRVFPELIKRHNELALVAHARIAENHLLAQLEAGSTAVTVAGQVIGAAPEIFNLLGRAVAAYRFKHRMNNVSPLRMVAPSWLLDLLRADLAMRMPGDGLQDTMGATEATINGWFRSRNVNITWHLDGVGPTQDSNSFDFPATVEFGLWAEGTWLYLDGGTLDLGVIRDSGLVATNQYKQFVETFEGLANMGCDSYWISQELAACGSAAALVETCA